MSNWCQFIQNFLQFSPRWVGVLLLWGVGLSGCVTTPPQGENSPPPTKPQVVVTTGVLCQLTQELAEDSLEVYCLVKPGQDPHTYQPQPEDQKVIETSQLILYGGYDHEPTLFKLIRSTTNKAPKIAVHEKAVPTPLMGEHSHDHDHVSSEKEVPDPHVWHSAKNGISIVEVLRQQLTQLNPNQSSLYAQNARKLTTDLEKIDRWIRETVKTIPPENRRLVTTHEALSYYTKSYGLELVGVLQGITTREQPTPQKVAELALEIKRMGIPVIFAEMTVNPKLIEAVAREANVKISPQSLFSDGLGDKGTGADTYKGMLMTNTCTIVNGLGGQCQPLRLDH